MNWDVVWVPLGGVLVAIVGVWGQRVAGKSEQQQKVVEARGPEWEAIFDKMQKWTETRLAERDKRIDGLEKHVERLAVEVETWKDKYWRAVQHIRLLRVTHPEPKPEVPVIIREDV